MSPEQVQGLIEAGIPGAEARVESGDHVHFEAEVVSDRFQDLPLVGRHQLVYRCLGEHLRDQIHALSIKTYTRAEWTARHAG
ncbi:MAG: BolA family protein [Gammaproteobacteria bacterium]